MKISRIIIKNVNQFKDIEIDLTYPEGHKKGGQPLDKICFIGQSGTGKTTLLKILKTFAIPYSSNFVFETNLKDEGIDLIPNSYIQVKSVYKELSYYQSKGLSVSGHEISSYGDFRIRNISYTNFEEMEKLAEFAEFKTMAAEKFPFAMYFPEGFKHLGEKDNFPGTHIHAIYDFSKINVVKLWMTFLNESVKDWGGKRLLRLMDVERLLQISDKEVSNLRKALKEWDKNNPNPLKRLANSGLKELLEKFRLKIYTDFNSSNIRDYANIMLQNIDSDDTIPLSKLSSAIQNIIHTSFPLYYISPTDSMIFYDEVENSFYPDVQQHIIDYYSSLAPDNQFFFSTHSPIIASSFEPWEIIELKFDERTGEVYQDKGLKFVTEGRRYDNYRAYPKYLRWDSILTDVFDLDNEGREEREQMLKDFAEVKSLMEYKVKNKLPYAEEERKYNDLGEKLKWWQAK